jgi:hypothetical protein
MKARIRSLTFDRRERPLRALILTPHGSVQVVWMDVAGDWCWFTHGTLDARIAAVAALRRLERKIQCTTS